MTIWYMFSLDDQSTHKSYNYRQQAQLHGIILLTWDAWANASVCREPASNKNFNSFMHFPTFETGSFFLEYNSPNNYPRRARSALGVDTVLTLDVCMFVCLYVCLYVCMYVSALERKRLIGMT